MNAADERSSRSPRHGSAPASPSRTAGGGLGARFDAPQPGEAQEGCYTSYRFGGWQKHEFLRL